MDALAHDLGQKMVQAYYQLLDVDRQQLAAQYIENGVLAYEGSTFVGSAKILEKLQALPQAHRQVESLDVQMIPGSNVLVAHVTGFLLPQGQPNGLAYSESFVFLPKNPEASEYAISNTQFRLVYPPA